MERVPLLPRNSHPHASLTDATYLPLQTTIFPRLFVLRPMGMIKNGVGYFQFSSKMLYFLGYENLKPYKNLFLRRSKDHKTPPRPIPLGGIFGTCVAEERRLIIENLSLLPRLLYRIERNGALASDRIIIVVGNRVLSRTVFDNAKIGS